MLKGKNASKFLIHDDMINRGKVFKRHNPEDVVLSIEKNINISILGSIPL